MLDSKKFLILFPNIWTEKVVDGLPNARMKVKLIKESHDHYSFI